MALALAACRKVEDAKPPAAAVETPADSLTVTGLSTPESAQYDETADVYFVSNINGEPLGRDDNGFISRVKPDGTVEDLKFIDGARPDVTLNAPKGIATHGDTLFVADIDTVRAFSISTRASLGNRGVPGATFLNDLAIGPDGALYVTDSGLDAAFKSTGTDAVYRFEATGPVAVAKGKWLSGPNGIVLGPEGMTIVPFGSKVMFRIKPGSTTGDTLATLPAGGLDGVVRLDANNFLATSWESKTVYHVDAASGAAHPVLPNMESPADIGYDTKRQRVLIPLFTKNVVEIRRLP
jgi:sugar lactone lactonase YvrE